MKLADLRLASRETGPWYSDEIPVAVEFVGNIKADGDESPDALKLSGKVVALVNAKLQKAIALVGADGLLEIQLGPTSNIIIP